MNKTIAIAGLGWLGLPLAHHLRRLGHEVKGSVTNKAKASSIRENQIRAYTVLLGEDGVSGQLSQMLEHTEVLIIAIAPGLRKKTGSNYALKMAHFLEAIEQAGVKKVVLVSSTAVYDDSQGTVTEKDTPLPELFAAKQLFEVEQLFFNSPHLKTSIVRFGGLYGGSRALVKFLAGRTGLRNGKAPVNLIHRDDCMGILTAIIRQDAFGHIFNGVFPEHPLKQEYYYKEAHRLGLQPPEYIEDDETTVFKQVDSIHLSSVLKYEFQGNL